MTNKAITLSREWGELVLNTCAFTLPENARRELIAALDEPVPPAGGKPDPIIAVLKGHLADGMNPMFSGGDLKHLIGLLEAGTRLQAEVERLKEGKALVEIAASQVVKAKESLQAELTKARELIGDLRADTQSGYLKAVQALHNWANQSAPRGYSNIVMTGTSCNQSAPADKGQGEPVAWANWKVGTKSYVPFRTKEEASRSVERSEIAATQLGPYRVVRLYAEQPAPVTVVLPERANAISGSHDYQSGYNTCIEDVIRLNGVKP